jgi:prephenate dehydrogenase
MIRQKATILGTGLLGASVGLALRSQGWSVSGWDPNPDALAQAVGRGAIETRLAGPTTVDSDLIVLAAPPEAVIETLLAMDTGSLVTDIAGVKVPVIAAADHLPHFVGGHPMAGGETSGPALAASSLFQGATWVLTSDGADEHDLETVFAIVGSFGANPVIMTAQEHDEAVARVSHLPHLLAATLMSLAESDPVTLGLAGGGFRDLTRIAAGDSRWWAEVLAANSSQVAASIDELQQSLATWKETLATGGGLAARLDSARAARLSLGEHNTPVRVVLLDRPGEIARVGHALERSRVDVRDFQLRHGEHGGGGILTISVRVEGKEALTMALIDEGFEVRVDA